MRSSQNLGRTRLEVTMRHILTQTNNRLLIFPKTFYFLFFAAASFLFPFLALYYEQLGLSGGQIGLLAAIPSLMVLSAASLWGGLADALQQHKRLLKLALLGTMTAVLVLSFTTTFFWLIPVVMAHAFFVAPIMPLIDNTVLDLLGDRKNEYGKQRLWGAIGWGALAPLAGWVVEQFGLAWSFYGYLVLMFGCLLVSWPLSIPPTKLGGAFWRSLRLLLNHKPWLLFLSVVFIAGVNLAITHTYLFLYLNVLGASKTLMGISLTFATFSEVVVFFFAGQLLNRLGIRRLLLLALLAGALRSLAFSVIQVPWPVLIVQLLHGPSFAMMWAAGVAYADRMAPQGMGATAQGLLTSVNFGLGAIVGALAGGFLYEHVGPWLMYRWAGFGVLAGLLLFAWVARKPIRPTPGPLKP